MQGHSGDHPYVEVSSCTCPGDTCIDSSELHSKASHKHSPIKPQVTFLQDTAMLDSSKSVHVLEGPILMMCCAAQCCVACLIKL